jgi:hypothetical protein
MKFDVIPWLRLGIVGGSKFGLSVPLFFKWAHCVVLFIGVL